MGLLRTLICFKGVGNKFPVIKFILSLCTGQKRIFNFLDELSMMFGCCLCCFCLLLNHDFVVSKV
jgi:hypothetical protein